MPVRFAGMRWEALFDDLEAQWLREQRADEEAVLPELVRAERAAVGWTDRLAVATGQTLMVTTAAQRVGGILRDLGRDWLLLEEQGRSALIPVSAVLGIAGLPYRNRSGMTRGRRIGIATALRGIARDRCAVTVHDIAGGLTTGSIDWVGADHLDVAEHPADAVRRPAAVTGHRTIPLPAVAVIRRAD